MPDPKKVRLIVVVPDPGEWCYRYSAPWGEDCCNLWSDELGTCQARFTPDGGSEGFRRPQSCKDSEVEE